MKLINLTPHKITIVLPDGTKTIESSGTTVRIQESLIKVGDIDNIPLFEKRLTNIINLPEPAKDTFYIVSLAIASVAKREDLLVPNTIRDETGRIIGCDGFAIIK